MRKRCTQGTSRFEYEYVREMELGKKLYCPSQGTSIYTVMVQRERYRLACIALLHYSVDLLSGCGQWRLFSRLIPIDHCSYHSNEVASIRSGSIPPCLFLLSTGSSRISTPGPTVLADDLCLGNICVVPHPHLKAISCASNSPNPSIIPLTNGNSRLIAAPLTKLQIVGRPYITTFCSWLPWLSLWLLLLDDCGGEVDGGEIDEKASESEGMVRPEADRSCGGDGCSCEGGNDGALFDIVQGT